MADKISQHTHCRVCGKAIPVSETLCSEECRQKFQSSIKRTRLFWYFLLGLMAASIAVIIITGR